MRIGAIVVTLWYSRKKTGAIGTKERREERKEDEEEEEEGGEGGKGGGGVGKHVKINGIFWSCWLNNSNHQTDRLVLKLRLYFQIHRSFFDLENGTNRKIHWQCNNRSFLQWLRDLGKHKDGYIMVCHDRFWGIMKFWAAFFLSCTYDRERNRDKRSTYLIGWQSMFLSTGYSEVSSCIT